MFRKLVLAAGAIMLCMPALASADQQVDAVNAAVWFADPAAGISLQQSAKDPALLSFTADQEAGVAASVDKATAAAVAEASLERDKGMEKQLKGWLSDGKQVYVYGDKLKVSTVARELGISELVDAEDKDAEKVNKGQGGAKGENIHIVGVKATGTGTYHVTSVKVDASKDGKNVTPPASLLLQAVLETEHARAGENAGPIEGMRCYECDPYPDPEEDPIPAPSNVTVLTGSDGTTKYVYNGSAYIAVASITSNWSLNRNYSHDNGANYDLFYIRDNLQIDLYNGATATNASTYHQLPYYSKDDIAGWGPSNSSVVTYSGAWRYYPAYLPWDVSWYSSNVGDLSFYSEYRANEAAYWNINAFSSKVTFSPGTAWVSYYTYAIIDLLHTVNVQYNGSTYSMTLNRTVTYDY